MKTYKCEFKTFSSDGKLSFSDNEHIFRTRDIEKYVEKTKARYANHKMRAEFLNITEVI